MSVNLEQGLDSRAPRNSDTIKDGYYFGFITGDLKQIKDKVSAIVISLFTNSDTTFDAKIVNKEYLKTILKEEKLAMLVVQGGIVKNIAATLKWCEFIRKRPDIEEIWINNYQKIWPSQWSEAIFPEDTYIKLIERLCFEHSLPLQSFTNNQSTENEAIPQQESSKVPPPKQVHELSEEIVYNDRVVRVRTVVEIEDGSQQGKVQQETKKVIHDSPQALTKATIESLDKIRQSSPQLPPEATRQRTKDTSQNTSAANAQPDLKSNKFYDPRIGGVCTILDSAKGELKVPKSLGEIITGKSVKEVLNICASKILEKQKAALSDFIEGRRNLDILLIPDDEWPALWGTFMQSVSKLIDAESKPKKTAPNNYTSVSQPKPQGTTSDKPDNQQKQQAKPEASSQKPENCVLF